MHFNASQGWFDGLDGGLVQTIWTILTEFCIAMCAVYGHYKDLLHNATVFSCRKFTVDFCTDHRRFY